MKNNKWFVLACATLTIVVLFIFLISPLSNTTGFLAPKDYDECILKHINSAANKMATIKIAKSCENKYPATIKTHNGSRALIFSEQMKLTGRAGPSGNSFAGSIYNGNKFITITNISFLIITKENEKDYSRIYTTNMNIPPQTATRFSFHVILSDDSSYQWSVSSAFGVAPPADVLAAFGLSDKTIQGNMPRNEKQPSAFDRLTTEGVFGKK